MVCILSLGLVLANVSHASWPVLQDVQASVLNVSGGIPPYFVTSSVFDPVRNITTTYDFQGSGWLCLGYENTNGIVAWYSLGTVGYVVYDPARGTWQLGQNTWGGTSCTIANMHGVVAWRYTGGSGEGDILLRRTIAHNPIGRLVAPVVRVVGQVQPAPRAGCPDATHTYAISVAAFDKTIVWLKASVDRPPGGLGPMPCSALDQPQPL